MIRDLPRLVRDFDPPPRAVLAAGRDAWTDRATGVTCRLVFDSTTSTDVRPVVEAGEVVRTLAFAAGEIGMLVSMQPRREGWRAILEAACKGPVTASVRLPGGLSLSLLRVTARRFLIDGLRSGPASFVLRLHSDGVQTYLGDWVML